MFSQNKALPQKGESIRAIVRIVNVLVGCYLLFFAAAAGLEMISGSLIHFAVHHFLTVDPIFFAQFDVNLRNALISFLAVVFAETLPYSFVVTLSKAFPLWIGTGLRSWAKNRICKIGIGVALTTMSSLYFVSNYFTETPKPGVYFFSNGEAAVAVCVFPDAVATKLDIHRRSTRRSPEGAPCHLITEADVQNFKAQERAEQQAQDLRLQQEAQARQEKQNKLDAERSAKELEEQKFFTNFTSDRADASNDVSAKVGCSCRSNSRSTYQQDADEDAGGQDQP